MYFEVFKPLIVALIFVLVAADYQIRARIFNGKDAVHGEFKYMASVIACVSSQNSCKWNICGGSIIGPNWVMTAAHCVDKYHKVSIYLGGIDRNEIKTHYKVHKRDMILHPEWSLSPLRNDIALILIPKTVECDEIAYAQLPFSLTGTAMEGKMAISMGWGEIGNHGVFPERLQSTLLAIINNNECNNTYGDIIERDLCVSTKKPFGSPCMGDSGTPLILAETGQQIGISSSIPDGSCEDGEPTIFVRVTSYLPWITQNTGISS